MGCATKVEGKTLFVMATFGEWTSKVGGARIELLLVVPRGVEVERREGLAGSDTLRTLGAGGIPIRAGRDEGRVLVRPDEADRWMAGGPH